MDPPRRRHLDASAGRDVVYCHSCRNEWFQDEHGLRCPSCGGEITEIITPGEDDPRDEFDIDLLRDLRRFDRTPHPYHHHQHENDSDPEEGHIDEHDHRMPGSFVHSTLFGAEARPGETPANRGGNNPSPNPNNPSPSPNNPNPNPNPNPTQPTNRGGNADDPDRTFVLRRFQEMLNDFRMGATGRSGRETLFPDPPIGVGPNIFQRQTTYSSGRRGVTMSFTLGGGGGGTGGGMPFPPNPFDQYDDSPPTSSPSSPSPTRLTPMPAITFVTFESTNGRPRMFNSMMGIGPSPTSPGVPTAIGVANNANQRVGQDLAAILTALLGTFGNPNGVHGDAVYTQEAMDRILTQLMEQNQGSNAPPPASQDAMDNLPRRRLDSEMLPEGRGECTICIQDVGVGDEVVVLPCNHWFHEECIMHWLREHGTCPICRQAVGTPGGQAAGSNQPPPSGSGSGSGPEAGAGAGSYQRQAQGPAHFTFFTTSSSTGSGGGAPGSTSRSGQNATAERGMARLNAIRNAAGVPPQSSANANQSSSSNCSSRSHQSRSRSPHRFRSTTERQRRSPSSQSRRTSMFTTSDRDRESTRERTRERDRDRRASYLAVGSSGNGSSGNGAPATSSANTASTGTGSGNASSGPFMGWLRNQFQGRRS